MRRSAVGTLVVIVALFTSAHGTDAMDDVGGPRIPFVIGAPGRLDHEGDRREPRLYPSADSQVAAYADVEVVRDPTWLRHEVEHYARRAVDCGALSLPWCGRTLRRVGSASAIKAVW